MDTLCCGRPNGWTCIENGTTSIYCHDARTACVGTLDCDRAYRCIWGCDLAVGKCIAENATLVGYELIFFLVIVGLALLACCAQRQRRRWSEVIIL